MKYRLMKICFISALLSEIRVAVYQKKICLIFLKGFIIAMIRMKTAWASALRFQRLFFCVNVPMLLLNHSSEKEVLLK